MIMYESRQLKAALKVSIFFLLVTGILHALSFIGKPEAKNDQEKQLIELTSNYQMDLGGGIQRTYSEIFSALSSCLTLICLFAGLLLWYILKNALEIRLLKGILHIYLVIFGTMFIIMACLTFWPPIICSACIYASLIWSRLAAS